MTASGPILGGSSTARPTTHLNSVEPPADAADAPPQMQIAALDYSNYLARLGVGRVHRGCLRPGQEVQVLLGETFKEKARVGHVLGFRGLDRIPVEEPGPAASSSSPASSTCPSAPPWPMPSGPRPCP